MTFAWDFGDGSPTSTLAAPTHTYQRAGHFVVRLTVRDREASAAAELPVVVNTLTGVWRSTSSRSEDGTLTLTQTSPSSFSGTRLMILFGQRRDCPFTGTIAYHIARQGTGSRVVVRNKGATDKLGFLPSAMIEAPMKSGMQADLARLKAIVEKK